MNVNIYAVTHKKVDDVAPDRILIGVGANKNIEGVSVYDNTKDNIEEKNPYFCEITALYWMWKNTEENIIGLEHYRRFFSKKGLFSVRPLSIKEIEKILSKNDIILSKQEKNSPTVREFYKEIHYIEDLDLCRQIIGQKFPEYLPSFDKVMDSKKASMRNMFVMNKSKMNEYCAWLFEILFSVEKQIDYLNRDSYQKRVFGFLAERLFNVWVEHQNFKIKRCNINDFNEHGYVLEIIVKLITKAKKLPKKIFRFNKAGK